MFLFIVIFALLFRSYWCPFCKGWIHSKNYWNKYCYEVHLYFYDGEQAMFQFFTNYSSYDVGTMVAEVFKFHSTVGIEQETGEIVYYTREQVLKTGIRIEKIR